MSGDTGDGRPGPKESPKRQRQLKRARVGWPSALRRLKELLYEVYLAAGAPSLDEIVGDIAEHDGLAGSPSRDTVHRVITDGERPKQQADVLAVATVLARRAAWDAPDLAGRLRELWVQAGMARGAGLPIGDLRGDVRLVLDGGLGVHPALDTDGARDLFGVLPAYVPRHHDARLKEVVDAAKAGRSGIAVLVGGSSTGKTRALWEAVGELPEGWRLWHPLTPTAPGAVLASLPDIAPRTVVWLNEAQNYLGPDPLGEQVAAGLREVLNDPLRAPVLVLGTLWPEQWDMLTSRTVPDRHAGARELLGMHKIDVPDAFTPDDLAALDAADPRLAQAAQRAKGAQITQYLAGVPYLMERYDAARGATQALIHAAMDARRLGAGLHLPLAWLADAAPGYLDDDEYHTLDSDWLAKALDYATTPCNGIPGILTLITNSRPRNQRTHGRPAASGILGDRPAFGSQGPHYLLADYLDQHGRRHRTESVPPVDFWTSATHHSHPSDLNALGNAAWDHGLYRDAAQLHKNATAHGDPRAAVALVNHLHALHPTDLSAARWATTHAVDDGPGSIVALLKALRDAGAHEQVTVLLARDPAARLPLDDPGVVAPLLEVLRDAGADEQVTVLLARDPATHVALDHRDESGWLVEAWLEMLRRTGAEERVTGLTRWAAAQAARENQQAVARLLRALWKAGAHEQVTTLARRATTHVTLDDEEAVTLLVEVLWEVGAHEQATALAEQAAFDNPRAIADLLKVLREAGAHEQATALAEQAAAHMALDDPEAVVRLLLKMALGDGTLEQITTLTGRAAAYINLDDPDALARLFMLMRELGAVEQIRTLTGRAVAHVTHIAPDNPDVVAWLHLMRQAGAHEQVTALLAGNPAAHVALDNPPAVASLLMALREVGAHEQITALAERITHVALDNPDAVAGILEGLWDARADEQFAALLAHDHAAHVALDNPRAVARLLMMLWSAAAHEQVAALAERAAAHIALEDFGAVRILNALRAVGADEQITTLAERAAAHIELDDPEAVTRLLPTLREVGAEEQITTLAERAAAHIELDAPHAIARLLQALREAGADQQATVLAERLPAAGHFDLFMRLEEDRGQFRLGREPDGSAASSWTWDDLD
ncbi:hypothetical protein ACFVRB_32920 [Streptomyces nojiriensis]|uniref:hypothetical protein n=1 Tax=Streptomyces nojiriensis TaxID=66374 RepID=UPI0036DF7C80